MSDSSSSGKFARDASKSAATGPATPEEWPATRAEPASQDEIDELRGRVDQLTALITAVQSESGTRIFTADPLGGVHLGRRGRRPPLALPGRPLA